MRECICTIKQPLTNPYPFTPPCSEEFQIFNLIRIIETRGQQHTVCTTNHLPPTREHKNYCQH